METLKKLQKGDKVAIVSPSSAAPGKWPHVYELGIQRVQEVFGLVPVSYPATAKIGASNEERMHDLVAAFSDTSIKAVISSIGGDDQVTYIKHLDPSIFIENPKPFFGFSDNSHFCNFLFLNGIPSYYGAALFTQFAMQGSMDDFTVSYIKKALFEGGEAELTASDYYNDQGLSWEDPELLTQRRVYEQNSGWDWNGTAAGSGILWGGCIESIDEMLRHNISIPTLEQFKKIVLMLETSEEIPSPEYVMRTLRALGERGVLSEVRGVLVGRPKAWEFDIQMTAEQKTLYRSKQQEIITQTVRKYNQIIPIVQNLDFGHTDPQIPMPYGGNVRIQTHARKIFAAF